MAIAPHPDGTCLRDTETGETLHCYATGAGDLGIVWCEHRNNDRVASGRKVTAEEADQLLAMHRSKPSVYGRWHEWHRDDSQGHQRFVRRAPTSFEQNPEYP